MELKEIETFLTQSLDDARLSRGERSTMKEIIGERSLAGREQEQLLHSAFALAAERLHDIRDRAVLEWLLDVVKVLRPSGGTAAGGAVADRVAEAWFMPNERGLGRLIGLLGACQVSLDICLYTLTHDRLAEAVLAAHRRGVRVRLIADDEKSLDPGSDVTGLASAGIPVRTDCAPSQMHNKFAVLDGRLLLTGSFNWTRSAAEQNQESFIISDEPALVTAHAREFERLWGRFAEE